MPNENLFNREIEMSIIGSLVMWHNELQRQIAEITPQDFYYADCRALFEIIKARSDAGDSIDLVLIAAYIPDGDTALKSCLMEAYTSPSTSVLFNHYLLTLKEMSQSRRIKQRLSGLVADGNTASLDDLQKIISDEKDNVFVKSYIDKSKADLQDFINNVGTQKQRIMLGFPALDKVIGGLRIPSVMMLGAYPSVGKTAFALNVAASQNKPVVFFSLEMSAEMIYERMVSSIGRIDYDLFSTQALTPEQARDAAETAETLKAKDFYVFDSIYDVEGHGSVIASIKPKLVVVDYIQKVRTGKKADNRRNEIDYISGMYKQIAKHNDCAIILLSQVSRIDRNEPNMSSLKESGALEADGDYVAILHRPYVIQKDDPSVTPEQAYILIDKNKFGNTGKRSLYFKGKFQRFYDTRDDYENPFK